MGASKPFTLDEVDPSILYCMFKGEPGTRKSTQALSFPKPQEWFSWDRKMSGILVPARKWGINLKDIVAVDYDDWTGARKRLEEIQISGKLKDGRKLATIILDSITMMADCTLRQTLSSKVGTTRASGQIAGRSIAGIAINELEDYGAETSALNELISLTKDINSYHKINVILIAHVLSAEYKAPGGKTHISRTIVTAGKRVAPKIPAACQEVYHFDIKEGMKEGAGGEYRILTQHTGDDFARTSLDLDAEIVFNDEPLYDKWLVPAIEKLKPTKVEEPKVAKGGFSA